MTIDELTVLFNDVTELDRDIVAMETARTAIQSIARTYDLAGTAVQSPVYGCQVKAWIDNNIDQLVLKKYAIQRRITNAMCDA